MKTRMIAVLVALAAVAVFTTEAPAMYHAGMGVFMQRDPGPGGARRVGAGGPAATGRFIPRDPTGQYADGMNLYAYVSANPVGFVDPLGLSKYVFDGKKLCCVSDDGKDCKKCWMARSGRPKKNPPPPNQAYRGGRYRERYLAKYHKWAKDSSAWDYSDDYQKKKNTGPIPKGTYTFDCNKLIKFKDMNWVRRIKYPSGAWGGYGVKLDPEEGTETHNRGGFHIHGGSVWGSAGCIDLTAGDSSFFNDTDCPCTGTKTLVVDYSGQAMPKCCKEPKDSKTLFVHEPDACPHCRPPQSQPASAPSTGPAG